MALKRPVGLLNSPRGNFYEIKQLTLLFFIERQNIVSKELYACVNAGVGLN